MSGGFNHKLSFYGGRLTMLHLGQDCHHAPMIGKNNLLDTLWCAQDALHQGLHYQRAYIFPSIESVGLFLFINVVHIHFRIDMTGVNMDTDTFKCLPCLETLDMGYYFNQPLADSLLTLKNLKDLYIDGLFRQPGLEQALPQGCHSLLYNIYVSSYYDHGVPDYLQKKMRYGSDWDLMMALEYDTT